VIHTIFKEYVKEVVLKYFDTTHETMHLDDFAGVLLCENCSSHIDEVMALLAGENIQLITFLPHTSHLFQPLDLVIFAAFKRDKREIHVNRHEGSRAWQMTKFMRVLEHATDSSNNHAAFKRTGLTINSLVFPPVAFVESRQLIEMIAASTFPDGAGVDGSAASFVVTQLPRAAPVF
jgi:hypothetical protein